MSEKLYVEVPDFLRPLVFLKAGYPRDEIDEVIRRREEATPHLLSSIESMLQHPEDAVEASEYMLPFLSMFLLAQFREKRAKPLMIDLARHPLVDDLMGDVVTEGLHAILAALCATDPEALKPVVEDAGAFEYARSSALEALATLCLKDIYPREDLSGYLRDLYESKLEKEYSFIWDAAIAISVDLGFREHREMVRQAYEDGLANPGMERLASVLSRLDRNRPHTSRDYRYQFVDDIHDEISHWACFRKTASGKRGDTAAASNREARPRPNPGGYSTTTYVRPEPKVGRNDPCPCGSGKKYKKCCGA